MNTERIKKITPEIMERILHYRGYNHIGIHYLCVKNGVFELVGLTDKILKELSVSKNLYVTLDKIAPVILIKENIDRILYAHYCDNKLNVKEAREILLNEQKINSEELIERELSEM